MTTPSARSAAASSGAPLEQEVWRLLAEVADPELRILSVVDLGMIRYVRTQDGPGIVIGLSPTYMGCPATEAIQAAIRIRLRNAGFIAVSIEPVLAPPWSSDWLSEAARNKLREHGIAPPAQSVGDPRLLMREPTVHCPRCTSQQTQRVSEFASTPCKALYRCSACLEPFEYFKCI